MLLPSHFRGMGAWRKNLDPKKPGKSSTLDWQLAKKRGVTKEREMESLWCIVQNEITSVLRCMTTSGTKRILNSAYSRGIKNLPEGCARYKENEGEYNERNKEVQVSQWILRGTVCCKKYDYRQHTSSPKRRDEWLREIIGMTAIWVGGRHMDSDRGVIASTLISQYLI